MPSLDIPGMPGAQMGMINLSDMLGGLGRRKVKRKLKVKDAYEQLVEEEADNLIDEETSPGPPSSGSRTTASSSSTRSTRSRASTPKSVAGQSAARACSATCCR